MYIGVTTVQMTSHFFYGVKSNNSSFMSIVMIIDLMGLLVIQCCNSAWLLHCGNSAFLKAIDY